MKIKQKYLFMLTFGTYFLIIGGALVYHLRRDIVHQPANEYVLESSCDQDESWGNVSGKTVLMSNVPALRSSRRKMMEESFWRDLSLDTLKHYRNYSIYYYKKTKYLNENFEVGKEYDPPYNCLDCNWENIMDWTNHYKDEIGSISVSKANDGTIFYDLITEDTGFGFRCLVDISNDDYRVFSYKSIEELRADRLREINRKIFPLQFK